MSPWITCFWGLRWQYFITFSPKGFQGWITCLAFKCEIAFITWMHHLSRCFSVNILSLSCLSQHLVSPKHIFNNKYNKFVCLHKNITWSCFPDFAKSPKGFPLHRTPKTSTVFLQEIVNKTLKFSRNAEGVLESLYHLVGASLCEHPIY